MSLARLRKLVRKGIDEFLEEDPLEKAAAVSYYALLALAPLLLVVLAIAGLVFDHEAVRGHLVAEIRDLVGDRGADAIELILRSADVPADSVASLAIGIVTLLIGASGVFIQLQSALNDIWDVKPSRKGNALWVFLRHRLISMAMVLALGFLMLVSLIVSAALSAIGLHYRSLLPWPAAWQAVNAVGSFLVITVLIAMVFRYLPDVRVAWRDVGLGALVTALLFSVGKAAIGFYLGRASIGSSYGAAGSVVVLVVWVYYASLIMFVGAQVTQFYSRWRVGSWPPAAS